MQQIKIPFQTDFKVFIRTEAGFALPFKFEFYTNMPSRPFVAKFDGYKYHNCTLLEDGRLVVAFDHDRSNFGMGKLMVKQTYYLNDRDYADEACDRVIAAKPVINIDDHEMRSEIVLDLSGDDDVEFTTQLPPYYQAGLTPEEHQKLIDETVAAEEAAAHANEQAELAHQAAQKADEASTTAFDAADNADQKAEEAHASAVATDAARANAVIATEAAQTAAQNANTKATLAEQKAGEAQSAATTANASASNADAKAAIAEQRAAEANFNAGKAYDAAVKADTAADNADAKAVIAQTAATNADTKAQLADQKATLANTAATNADQKAQQANTAAQNANTQANYAKEQGDYAATFNDRVTYLLHLFGQYATPDPQSLEIDPTRKDVAISAESMSEVAAQGWAISQPIVIRKGNIYRIKVGEASGQYVTTAMRYQYRDEAGNLRYAYKRKTQLDEHSELPVDGYLIMYGLPRDYELVVCFKYTAQYDPVVEVLTAGLLRTLAFQLGDMQDMIDQKLDVNGHSSAASVGGAMALLQKGDVPEDTYSELLTARMIGNAPDLMHVHGSTDTRTGIDDGKDVNVVVEKVWGDCIGGNQMVDKENFLNGTTFNGIVYSVNKADGAIKAEGTSTARSNYGILRTRIPYKQGRKILLIGCPYKGSANTYYLGAVGYDDSGYTESGNADTGNGFIITSKNTATNSYQIEVIGAQSAGQTVNMTFRPVWLDLTTLFPTDPDFVDSLTANDAIKVAHRLGFSAFTLD